MDYNGARQAVIGMLPKGGIGAEIGVWKGDYSAVLLAEARPKLLHLIDPWRSSDAPEHDKAWYGAQRGIDMNAVHASVVARFRTEIDTGQVIVHRTLSTETLAPMAQDSLDFAYVDGDHRFGAVRADLELAAAKVRPGGLIVADDHTLGGWWEDGVVRAVNELVGAHPRKLMIEFCWAGQVAIRKR